MNHILNRAPKGVKHLICINAVLYVAVLAISQYGVQLDKLLALYNPLSSYFKPYQVLTHMFVHSRSFFHVFFNMVTLWMFGPQIEKILGIRRFLKIYFFSGVASALSQVLFNIGEMYYLFGSLDYIQILGKLELNDNLIESESLARLQNILFAPMAGASGAIAGIVGAFAKCFPSQKIFILPFPFPIAIRKALFFFVLLSLVSVKFDLMPNIAHFAHIGGTLGGYLITGVFLEGDIFSFFKKKKPF